MRLRFFFLTFWNSLNFDDLFKKILAEVNKSIGLICQRQHVLLRSELFTIYKSLMSPRLDYRDVRYEKACNYSFKTSAQCYEYNTVLAKFAMAIGFYSEMIYQLLRL